MSNTLHKLESGLENTVRLGSVALLHISTATRSEKIESSAQVRLGKLGRACPTPILKVDQGRSGPFLA